VIGQMGETRSPPKKKKIREVPDQGEDAIKRSYNKARMRGEVGGFPAYYEKGLHIRDGGIRQYN